MRVYVRSSSRVGSVIAPFMMMFMGVIILIFSFTFFSSSPIDDLDSVIGDSMTVEAKLVEEEEMGAYDFILEYEVDGETYYYTETSWSGSLPTESDVMSVMVDPFNPEKVLGVSRSSGLFAESGDLLDGASGIFNGVKWGMRIIAGLLIAIGLFILIKNIVKNRRAANTQYAYNQPMNPSNVYDVNMNSQPMNNQIIYGETEKTYNLNGETYNINGEKID